MDKRDFHLVSVSHNSWESIAKYALPPALENFGYDISHEQNPVGSVGRALSHLDQATHQQPVYGLSSHQPA